MELFGGDGDPRPASRRRQIADADVVGVVKVAAAQRRRFAPGVPPFAGGGVQFQQHGLGRMQRIDMQPDLNRRRLRDHAWHQAAADGLFVEVTIRHPQGPLPEGRVDGVAEHPLLGVPRGVVLARPERPQVIQPHVPDRLFMGFRVEAAYRCGGRFVQPFFGRRDQRAEAFLPRRLLGRGELQERRGVVAVAVHRRIGSAVEERIEGVKILHRDRVVLVVVTNGAAARQPQPGLHRRARPVDGVAIQELLVDRPPFAGRHVAAIETGGDQLGLGRLGQQVAGQLIDREVTERLVAIERTDHPVAIGPDLANIVEVQPVRVAVPRHIQPMPSHLLAIVLRLEEPIDHLFVGVGGGIRQKRVDLVERWRQSGQREGDPSDQHFALVARLRPQPTTQHFAEQEPIDRRLPVRAGRARRRGQFGRNRWRFGAADRFEGPVPFVFRTLANPQADQFLLFRGQLMLFVRRRHDLFGIGRVDPLPDDVLGQFGRGEPFRCGIGLVQAKVGVPRRLVGPMAAEAGGAEQRPDISVETQFPLLRWHVGHGDAGRLLGSLGSRQGTAGRRGDDHEGDQPAEPGGVTWVAPTSRAGPTGGEGEAGVRTHRAPGAMRRGKISLPHCITAVDSRGK